MTTNNLRRATSVAEMDERFKNFRTDEGRAYALAFQPQAEDVFISPFAKSGTTWTQQIVHTLRTRGDMDFSEIMEVVPWLEMAYDLGIDLNAPQRGNPRAFKSHLIWDEIPKGARYIYIVRDPRDVIVSDYHFLGGWIFDMDAIPIDTYTRETYLADPYYWKHVNSWWSQRDNPDVLFMCYEEMRADLALHIRMIADFLHIDLDPELFNITMEHASFEFMKKHNRHFDAHMIRDHRNEALGLPPEATTTKVMNGRVGDHKQQLSSEIIEEIDALWKSQTNPRYKLHTYSDLRDKINAMNQIRFAHMDGR